MKGKSVRLVDSSGSILDVDAVDVGSSGITVHIARTNENMFIPWHNVRTVTWKDNKEPSSRKGTGQSEAKDTPSKSGDSGAD